MQGSSVSAAASASAGKAFITMGTVTPVSMDIWHTSKSNHIEGESYDNTED
jgi:hypothetical protein